ncbi:FliM/FliN family flagellar motor switch protein [Ahrensia sp. R2A130]|uniref:FliM/FliN family flagellar motor switch protein n=1 Tax=Ahrensia sp. R2A130 TaxID=744979 RepID=UPI0012E9F3EB|nr:FliM/FliN family flagellar motor switch protein [Ahrensia sp. R2A130]
MEDRLPARLRDQMLATRNANSSNVEATDDVQADNTVFKNAVRDMVSGRDDNLLELEELGCRLAVTLEGSAAEERQSSQQLILATEPDCGLTFTLDATAQAICLATLTGTKTVGSSHNIDGPLTRELIIAIAKSVVGAFALASKITLPQSPVWKSQDTDSAKSGSQSVVLGIAIPQKRSAALLKQEFETVLGRITLNIDARLMKVETPSAFIAKATTQDAVLTSEIDLRVTATARRMSLLSIGELQVGDVIGLPDDKLSVRASTKDGPLLEGTMVQVNGQDVFCIGDILARPNSAPTSDKETHQ